MDPRTTGIATQLAGVRRVVAVTGGKGGIGKSMVASTLALLLGRDGRRVGLLDLDLTGPCAHLILGVDRQAPEEEFGIEPPIVHGVRFMSVAYFTGTQPTALRGSDVTNALIELLAITRWGHLDVLVIDMPPGIGDTLLDALRLIPRAEYLVVATASPLVAQTVHRTLELLGRLDSRVLGVVENMRRDGPAAVDRLADEFGLPVLAVLPFDPTVESAVGRPDALLQTPFAAALLPVGRTVLAGRDAEAAPRD